MTKTKRLGLILSEEEKRWVVQLAKLEGGLSQASLIRRLIRQAADQFHLLEKSNEIINPLEVKHGKLIESQ